MSDHSLTSWGFFTHFTFGSVLVELTVLSQRYLDQSTLKFWVDTCRAMSALSEVFLISRFWLTLVEYSTLSGVLPCYAEKQNHSSPFDWHQCSLVLALNWIKQNVPSPFPFGNSVQIYHNNIFLSTIKTPNAYRSNTICSFFSSYHTSVIFVSRNITVDNKEAWCTVHLFQRLEGLVVFYCVSNSNEKWSFSSQLPIN